MPMGPDRLLAGLNDAQRAAVTSDAAVLCVVAGAGSGKTTVLARRVAWRALGDSADPDHMLVVTFTRKAATELRSRLARLGAPGIRAATFHAAAYAQLRRHWADQGLRPPALLRDPTRVLRRVLDQEPSASAGANGRTMPITETAVAALSGELSWARARLLVPDRYPEAARRAGRRPPLPLEGVAALYRSYEAEKRRRRVLDLDDLVVHCGDLLESDPSWAAAVRWQVRHLFVDEFQDVNPAQWRLLQAWRHGRDDLCVVGDPRQAIYGWNGSDPGLLERLPDLIPGTTVLHLVDNHRSTPQIVDMAGALLPAEDGAGPPTATRADGPVPQLAGFDDQVQEAEAVARWIRVNRPPGHGWGHLAVLARTHARLDPVAAALGRAGIPFHRTSSSSADPTLAGMLRSLGAMDRRLPLRAGLVDALAEMDEDNDEAVRLVTAMADDHLAEEPDATVESFLAWVMANQGDHDPPGSSPGAVELATFHQAKGLEWRAVAVVGLEDGTMPIAYATTDEAVAEERRLLYVALTRPEEHLWCSWAGGDKRPSPFLSAVRVALAANDPLEPSAAVGRVAELRRQLASVR